MLGCALALVAQTSPTQQPQQAPRTAPQVQQVLPSYEGQKVTTVELAGQPNLDTRKLLPLLVQEPGQPFSQAKVFATQKNLEQGARFQAVEIEIRPEADGVRVLFNLQPAYYFGVFGFGEPEKKFSYSRLLQISNYPPRGAYTAVDVNDAARALQTFYRRQGYFTAEVTPRLDVDEKNKLVNVIFDTNLGKRAKFGDVTITGADPQATAKLQSKLHSLIARLKSSGIRPGKTYRYKTLENATQYLETTLMKEDRLAAQVRLVGASYDPATNRADIAFEVKEGPLVHADVKGVHLWSWTKHKQLPIYQQAGVDNELIQEGQHNLVSYLQSKGYFDAQVKTDVQQQDGRENITYTVTKGPRNKVDDITIKGNQKLSEKDLKGHVTVKSAGWIPFFSHGKYSEHLVQQSANNIKRVYEAEGFSSVNVTPKVTKQANGNIDVAFLVNEGPQDVVGTLKFDGNNTVPESQLSDKPLKLAPGEAYSAKHVDEDRNEIVANYLRKGYLNASFRATATKSKNDPHQLDVVYHITEGPRVITASVIQVGQKHTEGWLISRTAKLDPEQPMRADDMFAAANRLYQLNGTFDWAEVDPRRTITTQSLEDVLIKTHEAQRNDIVYGFGFDVINRGGSVPSGTVAVPGLPPVGLNKNFKTSQQTFWGPRGSFQYTRLDIFGRAESLTVGGLAGRLDQRVSLTFTDPHFRGTDWETNFTTSGEHNEENPIFSSRLAEAGYQFQHALDKDQTQNIFLRYNLRETGLTRLLIPELVPTSDLHVRLSTFSASYIRDTRDNPMDAHKGIYESFEGDLTPGALGSSVSFAKVAAQAAYYKKIFHDVIWANSLRVGLEQPFAGSHVPLSEKFFTGGGSTLRGFSLNGAGPQRTISACGTPGDVTTCSPITVPVGGNQLVLINSELRIPIPAVMKNLGVAVFYDGGNVFQSIGFHDFWNQYTNNVGIGLRYATPVGSIRVDYGHNLDGIPGVKSHQIFVTIGQAF